MPSYDRREQLIETPLDERIQAALIAAAASFVGAFTGLFGAYFLALEESRRKTNNEWRGLLRERVGSFLTIASRLHTRAPGSEQDVKAKGRLCHYYEYSLCLLTVENGAHEELKRLIQKVHEKAEDNKQVPKTDIDLVRDQVQNVLDDSRTKKGREYAW